MQRSVNQFLRWILFGVLFCSLCCAIYFRWYTFLNYEFLKTHHDLLLGWTNKHYFYTFLIYMLTYIAVVALSLPAALLMTLTGGFLFGPIAILYAVVSATIGSTILFWIVQATFGGWFAQPKKHWVERLKKGVANNAFNYLLAIRLIPIFPFWAVNIAAGVLGVSMRVFILATFIGIIPGTVIYVIIGSNLNYFFQTQTLPDLKIIFTPSFFLPLLGLAVLVLLPIFLKGKKIQRHDKE